MTNPIIPKHEGELPNRIEVRKRHDMHNYEWHCTCHWDDGHSDFFKITNDGIGAPYVKQLSKELKDGGYIVNGSDDTTRTWERVVTLGMEGLNG